MRRRSRPVLPVLALGLGAVLAACGSSGGAATTASTTAAATTTTTAAPPTTAAAADEDALGMTPGTAATLEEARASTAEQLGMTDEQAGCVVDALVAATDEAKAIELVNDPRDVADLDPADAEAIVAAMKGCIQPGDVPAMLAATFHAQLKDAGVTMDHATCVANALTASIGVDEMYEMTTGFGSFDDIDPAVQGKVFQAVIDCVPPEVLSDLAAQEGDRVGATTTVG